MAIKYYPAPDIKKEAEEIVNSLDWKHVNLENVGFLRSSGSKAKRTIARCHALGKAMQIGMNRKKGFYLIEAISEKFDKLSKKEKTKVLIHELMHIPKSFGGGFVHHNIVNDKNVDNVYEHYCNLKEKEEKLFEIKKDWF